MEARQLLKVAVFTLLRFVFFYAILAVVLGALSREGDEKLLQAIRNPDHVPVAAFGALAIAVIGIFGDVVQPARRFVRFGERLLFVFAIFTFIYASGWITREKLDEVFSNIDPLQAAFWLTFATALKLCGITCGIARWRLLLRGQGIRLPIWYLTKCWFMGRAIGLFLPGTTGLDGYRLVESATYTGEVIKCTTVVAVEKLIGFMALAILVFLTLPLGMRLFDVNVVVLAIVLSILFVFIATAFLLLLNPRIVQVLVAVLPVPGVVRHPINKLGTAITAYSGHRKILLASVLLGLGIHLGTCMMYFGTLMAITGGEAELLDALFTSTLVITMSVVTPTISGLGVQEGGFMALLGNKYGATEALIAGHLGLWMGELTPFALSVPLLLFATRPNREKFLADLDAVRRKGLVEHRAELSDEQVRDYRLRLIGIVVAGLLGGLLAGALIGLGEAHWIATSLDGLEELRAYVWGPIVYSGLFAGAGLGVAAVLLFFYLMFDRFLPAIGTYALSAGGAATAGVLVIGKFRYQRDILAGHSMDINQNLQLAVAAVGIGLAVAAFLFALAWITRNRVAVGLAGAFALWALTLAGGYSLARGVFPEREGTAFISMGATRGPNVILVAVDTLRADYLPIFSESAPAKTPNLEKLAKDSAVMQQTFAQSSWTKPSFATIFTGLYPSAHTATTKTSALPDGLVTLAEALQEAGYYTKGYSNNPNITATFNFDQGFIDYIDLKPNLLFRASNSASKMSLYELMRHVWNRIIARVTGGKINVTDFYQPAESVTDTAIAWLDGTGRPKNAPFFLFVHYMDPHDPFMDWSNPGVGYARVQLGSPDPEKYRDKMIDAYRQEIEYLDQHLGRLFDGLRERDLYSNTLIVFTSDHGEEFHEHGGWWHGQTLYDEQIHVPLLMKLPASAGSRAIPKGFARHVDIAPTVLSIARVDVPEGMQGKSLFGTEAITSTYAEVNFEGNDLQSVRTDKHKLIRANEDNPRKLAPVEFYDLTADPKELSNAAGNGDPHEGLLQKATDDMRRFVEEKAAEPIVSTSIDQSELDQLESLGYLE